MLTLGKSLVPADIETLLCQVRNGLGKGQEGQETTSLGQMLGLFKRFAVRKQTQRL